MRDDELRDCAMSAPSSSFLLAETSTMREGVLPEQGWILAMSIEQAKGQSRHTHWSALHPQPNYTTQ
jgi:hypothetical protein